MRLRVAFKSDPALRGLDRLGVASFGTGCVASVPVGVSLRRNYSNVITRNVFRWGPDHFHLGPGTQLMRPALKLPMNWRQWLYEAKALATRATLGRIR